MASYYRAKWEVVISENDLYSIAQLKVKEKIKKHSSYNKLRKKSDDWG